MKSLPAILGGPKAVELPIPSYRSLGKEEEDAALRVMRSGNLSLFFGSAGDNFLGGPEVKAFESEWSSHFHVPYSISMNSATSGLIAAVGACEITHGDEVITSPFTMTASASCVRVFGGTPVFADIDPETFNLDVASIKRLITPRTRAIIVVDLAGQPADLDEIIQIARERGIRVIEDASQAPGAIYHEKWAGTLADIGIFSLNCHKTIQTGEGGVCCTHDPDLALRLQLIRNHGEAVVEDLNNIQRPEKILGFNFRLGELEAAIGREQLKKLNRLTLPRQQIAQVYNNRLNALEGLQVPVVKPGRTHAYYTYMMRLDSAISGLSRSQLLAALKEEGVECYEGYCRPLYLQPLYRDSWPGKRDGLYEVGTCPTAERLYDQEIFYHGLIYEAMRDPWVDQICRAFEKIWTYRKAISELKTNGARSIRRA